MRVCPSQESEGDEEEDLVAVKVEKKQEQTYARKIPAAKPEAIRFGKENMDKVGFGAL